MGGAEGAAAGQGLQARADRQLHRAGAANPAAGGAEKGGEELSFGPAGVRRHIRPAPAAAQYNPQQALADHGAGPPPEGGLPQATPGELQETEEHQGDAHPGQGTTTAKAGTKETPWQEQMQKSKVCAGAGFQAAQRGFDNLIRSLIGKALTDRG